MKEKRKTTVLEKIGIGIFFVVVGILGLFAILFCLAVIGLFLYICYKGLEMTIQTFSWTMPQTIFCVSAGIGVTTLYYRAIYDEEIKDHKRKEKNKEDLAEAVRAYSYYYSKHPEMFDMPHKKDTAEKSDN